MQRIRFVIQGPPVAWHRPQQTKHGHTFKNKQDVDFQRNVGEVALFNVLKWERERDELWKKDGEWWVDADFYLRDRIRRDIDNLLKNLYDGLKEIVFDDDVQIVGGTITKKYNPDNPHALVRVMRVTGYMNRHANQDSLL